MPRALLLLLRLRFRANARKLFRGVKTTRGALFLVMGLLLFGSWAVSAAFGLIMMRHAADLNTITIVAPMILLSFVVGTLLFSAPTKAIYFEPAEIDLLFPGPFTRRHLLVYKLTGSVIRAASASILISLFAARFAASWPAALIGSFLAILFNQFFSTMIIMARAKAARRVFTFIRQGLMVAITILLIAGIFSALGEGPADMWTIAQRFAQSPYGAVLLAPFRVFAQVFTATRFVPGLVGWSMASMAILAAMLFIVFKLDADYLEASVVTSQKMYERVQRVMRSGNAMGLPSVGRSRVRLPMLPAMNGAGPIAWRQLVTAMRNSRSLLLGLLIMAMALGPTLLIVNMEDRATGLIVPVIVWISIFLVRATAFDFRGDLDHMDWLRSMPIRPGWITLGEIAAPVIVLSVFHALLIASVAIIAREGAILWLALVFVIPWNAFSVSIENLMFMLYPARQTAVSPGDLHGIGRQTVIMMFKLALLAGGAMVAFGLGALAWLAGGESMVAGGVTAWLALAGVAAVAVMGLARTFRRFDPSLDMPV